MVIAVDAIGGGSYARQSMSDSPRVRRAASQDDYASAGALLHEFERVYDLESAGAEHFAARMAELSDELVALLASEDGEDVGLAVVRVRRNLYSDANEAYLAELYVREGHRRSGLGSELIEAAFAFARERGCDRIDLGTDEGDHDAHRLYKSFGFTNYSDPDAPPDERERMFYYERDL
jgi:GNAT superfamily N-acetyltransferase